MLPKGWVKGTISDKDETLLSELFTEFPIVAQGLEQLRYGDCSYSPKQVLFKAGNNHVKGQLGGSVQQTAMIFSFCEEVSTRANQLKKSGALMVPNSLQVSADCIVFNFFEVVK